MLYKFRKKLKIKSEHGKIMLIKYIIKKKEGNNMPDNMPQTRPAFHGSDIEQIEKYYGIPKESIVKFGANVNPLGLSDAVQDALAEHLDIITSYPDRDYKGAAQGNRPILRYGHGLRRNRERFYGVDFPANQPAKRQTRSGHRPYLLGI